jgi:chromosome segregation and condensation protein ScpB
MYGTALDFLQHFGLNSLMELPPLNLPEDENGENQEVTLKG